MYMQSEFILILEALFLQRIEVVTSLQCHVYRCSSHDSIVNYTYILNMTYTVHIYPRHYPALIPLVYYDTSSSCVFCVHDPSSM